jgi:hypothetical protein
MPDLGLTKKDEGQNWQKNAKEKALFTRSKKKLLYMAHSLFL